VRVRYASYARGVRDFLFLIFLSPFHYYDYAFRLPLLHTPLDYSSSRFFIFATLRHAATPRHFHFLPCDLLLLPLIFFAAAQDTRMRGAAAKRRRRV